MIQEFSLERVNKSPASFDPNKLSAFQIRHMQQLPVKQEVAMVLPFLQKAGYVATPPPCDTAPKLTQIVEAAGDRIKTAGDILELTEFFVSDEQLEYDEKAFEKRIRKPEDAGRLLSGFRARLAETAPFEAEILEHTMREFIEEQGVKLGQLIHAVRVAVTGKAVREPNELRIVERVRP